MAYCLNAKLTNWGEGGNNQKHTLAVLCWSLYVQIGTRETVWGYGTRVGRRYRAWIRMVENNCKRYSRKIFILWTFQNKKKETKAYRNYLSFSWVKLAKGMISWTTYSMPFPIAVFRGLRYPDAPSSQEGGPLPGSCLVNASVKFLLRAQLHSCWNLLKTVGTFYFVL